MNEKLLKNILPPVITALLLLIIFYLKNIFPFGAGNISSGDVSQLFVPMYTHLYDALHNTKSLFFDWYSAAGNNMAGIVSFIGLLNPLNLFFYFVPRENILEYMSIYLVIKMMLSNFAMSIYLSKTYKNLNVFYHIIFSLLYSFSGYVLQYYSNINWLDFTILFPLLILSLNRLLKSGKYGYYILLYTLCLISSIYMSFMVTIFLIIYAGAYCIILLPKAQKKEKIFKFAISSLISLLLSGFILIPSAFQMLSSIRSVTKKSFFRNSINSSECINKWLILLCLEFPLATTLKLFKYKNKKSKFLLFTTLMMILPLIFERINLVWHTGSYVKFPMRFGFILAFMLIACSSYYFSHFNSKQKIEKDKIIVPVSCFLFIIILMFSLICFENINWCGIAMSIFETIFFVLFIGAFLLLYTLLLEISNNFAKKLLILFPVAFEILFMSYGFLAPTFSLKTYPEQSSDYIEDVSNIKNILPETDNISRIKCKDFVLSSNYPYILSAPSLSNWTNFISPQLYLQNIMLGYATNYTRLLDFGGTIFSDTLLNYTYILSKNELSDILYENIQKTSEFNLYKSKFSIPFGIIVNNDIKSKEFSTPFDYQNELAKLLTGEPLMNILPFSSDFYIEEESVLYLWANTGENDEDIIFKINDTKIHTIKSSTSSNYQKAYGGIIDLGIFKNQAIHVDIISKEEAKAKNIFFALIPISKLEKLNKTDFISAKNITAKSNKLNLTVSAENENSLLFLPIAYDCGWNVYVNNEKISSVPLLNDTFIGILLNSGYNNIEMKFIPTGLKYGILTFVAGIILLLIIKKIKFLQTPTLYIFYGLLCFTIFIVYVFPLLYNIKVLIIRS